ncbi:hypothetical protein [Asanoa sp. NPDC050611]|uniref:hypothetical protein n=1 Tax=Asanoa sp. NPDC050611 TaxID=3157098 RepID=UPI0033FC6E25
MSTRKRETTNSWLKYHRVSADRMVDILADLPDVLGADPLTREELADTFGTLPAAARKAVAGLSA